MPSQICLAKHETEQAEAQVITLHAGSTVVYAYCSGRRLAGSSRQAREYH